MTFIQTYFVRVYSRELQKQGKDERAAHREALFQTRFLMFLPAVGLGSTTIVVLSRLSSFGEIVLSQHRAAVSLVSVACLLLVTFLVAGRAIRKIENVAAMAALHSRPIDRLIPHIQFWCTLLISVSLPLIVALVLPETAPGRGG